MNTAVKEVTCNEQACENVLVANSNYRIQELQNIHSFITDIINVKKNIKNKTNGRIFVVIEIFDCNNDRLKHILSKINRFDNNYDLVFIFSQEIRLVIIKIIVAEISKLYQRFWYIQVLLDSKHASQTINNLIGGTWNSIEGLKQVTSKTNNVNNSFEDIKMKIPEITHSTRFNAQEFIQNILSDSKEKENPSTIEQQIYLASNSNIQEYLTLLTHYKILNESSNKQEFSLKRKRTIDNGLVEPKCKKQCLNCPIYYWYYSLDLNEEPYLLLSKEINNDLEEFYRESYPFYDVYNFFGYDKCTINLFDNDICVDSTKIGTVRRKIEYNGNEVDDLPFYWTTFQNSNIAKFNLDIKSELGDEIKSKVEENISNSKVNKIVQIQNLEHLIQFQSASSRLQLLHGKEVTEKLNFMGSNFVHPEDIINDPSLCIMRDIQPDYNWGLGAHTSSSPLYADERAFIVFEDSNIIRKQIFLLNIVIGESVQENPDVKIRRPKSKTEVNNLPILYDAISGSYRTSEDISFDVDVIYEGNQILPAFLIEYEVKK